jgi:hypothetical protein
MKLVKLTRDMYPNRAGDTRLLPDNVAARLEASGEIEPNPPDWPARPAPVERHPLSPPPSRKDERRRHYQTKG